MAFCSNCGIINPDNATFCYNCGEKLASNLNHEAEKGKSTQETEGTNTNPILSKSTKYALYAISAIVVIIVLFAGIPLLSDELKEKEASVNITIHNNSAQSFSYYVYLGGTYMNSGILNPGCSVTIPCSVTFHGGSSTQNVVVTTTGYQQQQIVILNDGDVKLVTFNF